MLFYSVGICYKGNDMEIGVMAENYADVEKKIFKNYPNSFIYAIKAETKRKIFDVIV